MSNERVSDRRRPSQSPMSGIGLPIGAGFGIVGGLLVAGGLGVSFGLVVGASIGVVTDAIVCARRHRPS